jgi:hypothetical protein
MCVRVRERERERARERETKSNTDPTGQPKRASVRERAAGGRESEGEAGLFKRGPSTLYPLLPLAATASTRVMLYCL